MSASRRDVGWTWSIGVIALALLVLAIIDFARPGSGETVDLSGGPTADRLLARAGTGLAELYHLLPDATADLGRAVQVAGTVTGQPTGMGFWVRDLRDNIVFVSTGAPAASSGSQPRAGAAVRARGLIELFPPTEQDERLRAAGLVVPAGTVVIRDVKISAFDGGIEVLKD